MLIKNLKKTYKRSYFLLINLKNFLIPNYYKIISKKLSYPNIPRCEQKTIITGKGQVNIGDKCSFGYRYGGFFKGSGIEFHVRYENAKISIGDNVLTNNNLFLCSANLIEIGDNTLIGQNVTIMDFEAHDINPNNRKGIGEIGKVVIGKNVWIGNNVTILKNSVIGNNSIIATGAVVSGKFPENVIVGGIPAKIIKEIIY